MKNLLKFTFILSIVFTFNLHTFGQQQFGIKVSGGISRIYGQLESNFFPEATMSTSFSPSFQAGIYYLLPTGKKTLLGAELLYSNVQGGQIYKWEDIDIIDGYVSYAIYEHVSYF